MQLGFGLDIHELRPLCDIYFTFSADDNVESM